MHVLIEKSGCLVIEPAGSKAGKRAALSLHSCGWVVMTRIKLTERSVRVGSERNAAVGSRRDVVVGSTKESAVINWVSHDSSLKAVVVSFLGEGPSSGPA